MRFATLAGGPLGCAAVAWLSCLGCGGDVALNGLAPVDAGAPGLANDTANETGVMTTQPVPEASSVDSPEGGDVEDEGGDVEDRAQAANCGPTNCHGCCDDDGYCETGDQSQACGAGGGACQACAGNNGASSVCSGGVCSSPVDAPCSRSTCSGCCDAQGNCVGGESLTACGAAGIACLVCPASANEVCRNGICAMPVLPTSCAVSSCPPCIPAYQAACCKTDNTCGCAVQFPPDAGGCE